MTTRSSIALFSTLLLASATAQPTLNLANNGPVPVITPYDVSTYGAATETYGPGEPGASSIYSFWMVPQTGNNAQYFVAPTVTPTSNSIPGTTVISTDGRYIRRTLLTARCIRRSWNASLAMPHGHPPMAWYSLGGSLCSVGMDGRSFLRSWARNTRGSPRRKNSFSGNLTTRCNAHYKAVW